jgi:HEAT repeat protein
MDTNRTRNCIFFLVGVTLVAALTETGCSIGSVSPDRHRQIDAAVNEYERNRKAESAALDRKRAEEFQRSIADPGSLSIQESDTWIEKLRAPGSFLRAHAAEKLGEAKGRRAVDPLIGALRTETDESAFIAIAEALRDIRDPRAIDALAASLSAQNIPDSAREQALIAIGQFGSEARFLPQIQRFYDSLTDNSVRARTRQVLERYGK